MSGAPGLSIAFVILAFAVAGGVWHILYRARIERLEQDVKSEQGEVARLMNRLAEQERQIERVSAASASALVNRGPLVPHEPIAAKMAAPAGRKQPNAEKVLLGPEVTLESLVKMQEGMTNIQAQRTVEPFIGKWMTISGAVYEVKEIVKGEIAVTLETPNEEIPLYRRMANTPMACFSENLAAIEHLRRGDEITVFGMLEAVNEFGIRLIHAELVRS